MNIAGTKLYVDGINGQQKTALPGWAVVHATQSVHYPLMGWDRRFNKPPKDHPNYIIWKDNNRLSLNWVDGGAFLYDMSGPETFMQALDFIDKHYPDNKIMIHCDQGQSRSPTLAMLYMAKRLSAIPDDFYGARNAFTQLYPGYAPGGIAEYVASHWSEIK